jgi:hypothetical protein
MSRGLTDPTPQPDDESENEAAIRALIIGQNKLHDRLIDLERKVDHLVHSLEKKPPKKKWTKGL